MIGELDDRVAFAHQRRLSVLGVTTTFATNSPEVLDVIGETYGAWARVDVDAEATASATVRVAVLDDLARASPSAGYRHLVPDRTRMIAVTGGGVGVADTSRREAVLYVTPALLSRRAEFVDGMLEALTLFVLVGLDRLPVHAAAIARGDVAILLAGPSGSGKSTLTYAASRRGFTPLADEPVYVQTEPVLRVWGRGSRIHLTEAARSLFPELREHVATRLPSGKSKLVVQPEGLHRPYSERPGICIVARSPGSAPRLERLSPEAAVAEMTERLDEGYDIFADAIPDRLARIAERGAWRLTVTGAPDGAIRFLEEIATELERSA